jgi:putative transposase
VKKSWFTEEQIIYALRLAEYGSPVADVCRQLGINEATFYVWKKKYASLGVSELRQLRQLQEGSARLRRLVADLTLDKQILSEVIQKNLRPVRRQEITHWIHERFQMSARRPRGLSRMQRSTWYYRSQARD